MPIHGRSTLPISPARILAAALAALAVAPAAASAEGAKIRWRSPDQGDRLRGQLAGGACQIGVHAPKGVRRVGVKAIRMGAKHTKIRRPEAIVRLRRIENGRYTCTWNTQAVRNATYRLVAMLRTPTGKLVKDKVTVRVRNPRAGKPHGEKPSGAPSRPVDCARRPFPLPLHSDPPSTVGGDVSRAFVDAEGCKVTFNGFNIVPVNRDTGAVTWDDSHYQDIRRRGFNALRFVLSWKVYEPQAGKFAHVETIDRAVAAARKAGLYVIFDAIHIDRWNPPPGWVSGGDEIDKVLAGGKSWIQFLAQRYKNEPTVAGYDLVNEPPSFDQNRILKMYSTMIGWLREVDPEKVVLTNAGRGNSDMSPKSADPANLTQRRNVVHTTHDYFAGDGNTARISSGYADHGGNANNQTWNATSGYPNPSDQSDFDAQLQLQMDYARRADVAYLIGEYGINAGAANAQEWAAQKTALYQRYGLSRLWWLYACDNRLGIKDKGCKWKGIAGALGPLTG